MKSINNSRKHMSSVILILAGFFLFFICGEWFGVVDNEIPKATLGIPTIYSSDSDLTTKHIERVVSDGKLVYVLFDRSEGIVKVYDTDGNYQHSIAFFNSYSNGSFQIASADGVVYVCDQRSNLYLFRDGEFVAFISNKDCEALRRSIDFQSTSEEYVVHMESVWRLTEAGRIRIIERPITAIVNRYSIFIGSCVLIFIRGIYLYFKRVSN